MKKLFAFAKKEAVLSIAAVLAAASAFAVHPDRLYWDYIDFRTLAILLCLMSVMAGLRRLGIFDRMGGFLLSKTKSFTQVALVLVGLCFVGSMIITNDVALITFVPFAFVVLKLLGAEQMETWIVPIVGMQTIAANLGSMLTPIGNPQNLYLYGLSGLGFGAFLNLMLPYAAVSAVLLILWAVIACRKAPAIERFARDNAPLNGKQKKLAALYGCLFAVCLACVARFLPYTVMLGIVLVLVLIFDRQTFSNVDYSLLLTFVAFFIFIGNLGRIEAFSTRLGSALQGREVLISVLASQVTSNVPAALLLSGFTGNIKGLIVGTNLGGLGTLIASMASLISYRQICAGAPAQKGKYFKLFTVSNVVFLAILLAFHFLVMA